MKPVVIYLGGNGHCAARLSLGRAAITRLTSAGSIRPFSLHDVPYPGFEDRPRVRNLDTFLADVSTHIAGAVASEERVLLYATGIGGLLALCLRARGEWLNVPLLLQAPVLWGLEHRWMPRMMRFRAAQRMLHWMFDRGWFQRRFMRQQLVHRAPEGFQAAFFDGYARCPAAADFFAWLTPALLRDLEHQFARRPEALQLIRVWWGERDHVVDRTELAWTEKSLSVHWPVRTFPHWGHYPMIDDPEEWVRALSDDLASPEKLS